MIYAIRAEGTQFIKFGYVKDEDKKGVAKRISLLQTGSPYKLKAIAWAPGGIDEERKIHYRLKRAGLFARGEWFKDGKEAQQVIWEMRESNGRDPEALEDAQNAGTATSSYRASGPKHRLSACLALNQSTSHPTKVSV